MQILTDQKGIPGRSVAPGGAWTSPLWTPKRKISSEFWRPESLWIHFGWLVTTSAAMILGYALNVPNASVFLILAVVYAVYLGGVRTGIFSASLATLYSAIFLSIGGQLFHYTAEGSRALIVLTASFYGVVFLTMYLRISSIREAERAADRVRAQSITDESEMRFRNLADAAPVPLWVADAKGQRFFFNQHWLQHVGRTLEQEFGDGWQENIHPEDREAAVYRYTVAVKNLERYRSEYRIRNVNGEYRWIEDFGSPRMAPNGERLGYLGSYVDRTERKRAEMAMHQLSGKLLGLQDEERRRISRELHDTTAQNLAAISMNLSLVKEAAKVLNRRSQDAIAESLALAEQCSQEIRTLSYLLHPPLLDELGLVSALRAYTTGFTQRTGILIELKMAEIGRLPGELETTLFRIVQEALTNVHRHSGSSRAEIRIVRDPKGVRLQVSDFGRGVPSERLQLIGEGASLGVGIAGMRERAIQLGGQLKIGSSDQGTTITAILPLKQAHE